MQGRSVLPYITSHCILAFPFPYFAPLANVPSIIVIVILNSFIAFLALWNLRISVELLFFLVQRPIRHCYEEGQHLIHRHGRSCCFLKCDRNIQWCLCIVQEGSNSWVISFMCFISLDSDCQPTFWRMASLVSESRVGFCKLTMPSFSSSNTAQLKCCVAILELYKAIICNSAIPYCCNAWFIFLYIEWEN